MKRPLKLPTNPARVRVENKALWNEARTPERADFFTLGYEGRTTASLIEALQKAGVRSLLDIRHAPVSMYRPELSKSNFQKPRFPRWIAAHPAPNARFVS